MQVGERVDPMTKIATTKTGGETLQANGEQPSLRI